LYFPGGQIKCSGRLESDKDRLDSEKGNEDPLQEVESSIFFLQKEGSSSELKSIGIPPRRLATRAFGVATGGVTIFALGVGAITYFVFGVKSVCAALFLWCFCELHDGAFLVGGPWKRYQQCGAQNWDICRGGRGRWAILSLVVKAVLTSPTD